MEEKYRTKSGKEKPRSISAEKKRLSEAEDKLVVLVPPVGRLRVIRVQLELCAVAVQIEHVRVVVAIDMYAAPSYPPPLE